MGYRSALLLACMAGSAFAQMADVAVYLNSDGPLALGVSRSIQMEAESILARSAVHVIWTSQPDRKPYPRIAVISLRGSCRLGISLVQIARFLEPVGESHISEGPVLPFAEISCDAIHRVIDRDLYAVNASDRERLLGRALGRVLAHELYHILWQSSKHGHSGITRPALSSWDLLRDR